MKNINGSEITEKDIESAIKYLKIHDPQNATYENAVKMLQGMQITAHMLAHDIVDTEQQKKNEQEVQKRSKQILERLRQKYPNAKPYDLDGRGLHFLSEIEPVTDHPEYDRAVEVILLSKPHKHLKMTQDYTILSGTLELHVENETIILHQGEKYRIEPGQVHWAKSDDECWVEIYSNPGWTKEDHIHV